MKFIKYIPTGVFMYFGVQAAMLGIKADPFSLASVSCYSLGSIGFAISYSTI